MAKGLKQITILAFACGLLGSQTGCLTLTNEPDLSKDCSANQTNRESQVQSRLNEPDPVFDVEDPGVCEPLQNYQCEVRSFRPDFNGTKVTESRYCPDPLDPKKCASVTRLDFGTENIKKSNTVPPKEFEPGGIYHYETVSCANISLRNVEGDPIQLPVRASGVSVDEAIKNVHALCLRLAEASQ